MRYSPVSGWVQFTSVVTWIGLYLACTPFFYALLARVKRLPADVSWTLSKLLGFYFFGWLVAAPASLGFYSLSNGWLRAGFLLFVAIGLFFFARQFKSILDSERRSVFRDLLRGELVFLLGFGIFTLLWSLHPELKTGEKSMNFSFLNFFIRNENFPPEDPWAAGVQTHYYYFGSFAFALWHRLGEIPSSVGYGLSIATSAGFLGCVSYAFFRFFGMSFRRSLFFSAVVLLAGNIEVLFLYFSDQMPLRYELFWESSRVFSNGRFSEYPLWTYLFGDLHAHNMALPFGILAAFFFSELLRATKEGAWSLVLAFSIIAGLLPISNTWDVFLISAFVFSVILVDPSQVLRVFPRLLGALVLTILIAAPFHETLLGGRPAEFHPVVEEWVTLEQTFRFSGFPILLILLRSILLLRGDFRKILNARRAAVLVFHLMLPLALVAVARTFFNNSGAWPVEVLWVCLPLSLSVGLLGRDEGRERERALILTSILLIVFVDSVSVFDRTITLFKCYFQVSALLWIAALSGLPQVDFSRLRLRESFSYFRYGLVALSLFSGGLLTLSLIHASKSSQEKPSLDSTGYLLLEEPKMAKLIGWIQENITGTARVLDAWGSGEMTRVTVNIGFPDFAHWEAHTLLRGVPHPVLIERRDLIREFYTTSDPSRALSILKSNGIQYFMVTNIERKIYANENPNFQKFSEHPELFRLVHEVEGEAIYSPI